MSSQLKKGGGANQCELSSLESDDQLIKISGAVEPTLGETLERKRDEGPDRPAEMLDNEKREGNCSQNPEIPRTFCMVEYRASTTMAFPGLLEGQRNQPKPHADLFPRSWSKPLLTL